MSLSIYDLVPLGFEVLEVPEFDEEDIDKEANKDLTEDTALTVTIDEDNKYMLHVVQSYPYKGYTHITGYRHSKPYKFNGVEELKDWMENIYPNLEIEFH